MPHNIVGMAFRLLVVAFLCVVATVQAQSPDEVSLWNVILNGGKLTLKNDITLSADLPLIPAGKTVSITGALNGKKGAVTIDGRGLYNMFKSSGKGGVTLSLTNLIIQNAKELVNGLPSAAVDISDFNSILTVSKVIFKYNGRALNWGGTAAKISDSQFLFHKDTAVYLKPSGSGSKATTFTNCLFNSNTADKNLAGGGAIHVAGSDSGPVGSVFVSKSTFSNNNAQDLGGAVALQVFTTGTFLNCKFQNNYAPEGGAIHAFDAYFTTVGCTFSKNSATFGGAISVRSDGEGKNSLSKTTFLSNTASTHGGAFYMDSNDDLTICSCTFKSNTANGVPNNGHATGDLVDISTPSSTPIPLVTVDSGSDPVTFSPGQCTTK